jgi:hypothetical protein
MENALDEEDSYADITLGVLRQVERLLRGIFLVEDRLPEELVEAVSARLDEPTRKYLEHVASEGQPLTLGAVEVWLRGLDRAWAATDPLVTDQLRSLLRDPGRVFGKSRLPRGVQRWRPLRNRLAHGDHALPVSEHRRVCTSVLARAGVDEFVKKAVLPSQSVIVGLMIERSLMIRPA